MKRSRWMLVRQWQVIRVLSANRYGQTIPQLQETTGRSRATVYRDLSVLRDSGTPIESRTVNGEARYGLTCADRSARSDFRGIRSEDDGRSG